MIVSPVGETIVAAIPVCEQYFTRMDEFYEALF